MGEKATIVPVLGDLRDREYTEFILNRLKADVIFHCAAYKHVPMLEHHMKNYGAIFRNKKLFNNPYRRILTKMRNNFV